MMLNISIDGDIGIPGIKIGKKLKMKAGSKEGTEIGKFSLIFLDVY